MPVEAMPQRQLKCAECLHFTDHEEIVVEEGVDDRVRARSKAAATSAGAVPARLTFASAP